MSTINLPPLLITSAINIKSVPYLSMTDSSERLRSTLSALKAWQDKYPNIEVVIVDGTGFKYEMANNSRVEVLSYENNSSAISKLGKGYGEAEDIEFALMNSKIIKNSNNFMKVTGKRMITNLDGFDKTDLYCEFKCKPVVGNRLDLLYINTAFFCASRDVYLSLFKDIKLSINDSVGDDLEHVMAERIRLRKQRNYCFSTIPRISGWDGTSNSEIVIYNDRFRHMLRTVKYFTLSKVL